MLLGSQLVAIVMVCEPAGKFSPSVKTVSPNILLIESCALVFCEAETETFNTSVTGFGYRLQLLMALISCIPDAISTFTFHSVIQPVSFFICALYSPTVSTLKVEDDW